MNSRMMNVGLGLLSAGAICVAMIPSTATAEEAKKCDATTTQCCECTQNQQGQVETCKLLTGTHLYYHCDSADGHCPPNPGAGNWCPEQA
jgi:hypothetical protein